MIPGGAPLASTPLASIFGGATPGAVVLPSVIAGQSNEPGVWLVDIVVTPSPLSGPPPVGILPLAMAPVASPDRPGAVPAAAVPVLRVSDRGWIGEPADSVAPNAAYPGRLVEPPALEAVVPIYPDAERRLAVSAGELRLANGDGALDGLAGDWSVAGRPVALRRGPHRRPAHAPFAEMVPVASLRASAAAVGTSTLALPLRPAAADLDLPACNAYTGGGGAEGPAGLAGQTKPRLYGRKRNLPPVLVDPGLLLYQLHDGPVQVIDAVRDRGVPLTNAGDLASYAALAGAAVSAGTYQTCLAAGLFRVGATPSLLTADAQGDNAAATGGYNAGTVASIARKLLTGLGGVATFTPERWSWPSGEAGLFLTGGTVADAMTALAGGVAGWWGTDASGAYQGGQLAAPEALPVSLYLEPSMLAAPPEELGTPRAPWWRVRVGARAFGVTQAAEQLAGSVSAADRQLYGQPYTLATAFDAAVASTFPLAEDAAPVVSAFDLVADAQSLADQLLALFKRPRRMFQVQMRPGAGGLAWPTLQLGACVSLRWPQRQALASGRVLLVVGVSSRGDATTLTLWG